MRLNPSFKTVGFRFNFLPILDKICSFNTLFLARRSLYGREKNESEVCDPARYQKDKKF